MARRLLIDTDTASDDAVALVMALRNPDVEVAAITVVAGNVPLAQGVQNALYTRELCDSAVPVHAGLADPLLRPLRTAQFVHGEDGMGDLGLPLDGRRPNPGHAVDAIVEMADRHAGDIDLVTLGPLTNIATAVRMDPSIVTKYRRMIMMGGTGRGPGNITPVAEYNVWVDPEAADIVFSSAMPVTLVGWDVCHAYATFTPADEHELLDLGTPLARFCVDIQGTLREFAAGRNEQPGYALPDPIAMAIAIDPTVAATTVNRHVRVETASRFCDGQTVVDHLGVTDGTPDTEIVVEASRERFLAQLHAATS